MAVPAAQGRKPRATQVPHYYEGYLEKKVPWEKEYKKFWAGLRGLILYFYNTNRDVQYVDQLDLADFVSLTDDNPPRTVAAWSTEGAKLTIRMKNQEVKLKMESLESREMWKGFILTMVEMKVPSSLALLPGHIYMLSEALEKEQRFKTDLSDSQGFLSPKTMEHSILPRREAPEAKDPDCFFRVSRTEAEMLLEKNESCGNMLLRPGRDGKSISVTTRQLVNGTPDLKHYKINQVGKQYIIDVEDPYCCSSLAGVVEFFVKTSKHTLIPLKLDDSYAETLEFVWTDNENGESTRMVSKPLRLPDIHPPSPRVVVPEQPKKPLLPPRNQPLNAPPRLPSVPPAKTPQPSVPDNEYMVEDEPEQTYMNPEAEIRPKKTPRGKCQPPQGEIKVSWIAGDMPPKVPPVPPKPDIRAVMTSSNLTRCTRAQKPPDVLPSHLARSLPRGFSIGMSEELKKKLQERRVTLELSETNISS